MVMTPRWARPSTAPWLGGLVVGVTLVAAVSALVGLIDPHVPALNLLVLYILAVLPVAVVWGTGLAAVTAVLSILFFAYLFAHPAGSLQVADPRDLIAMGVFLVTAVVVGQLTARTRRAAVESARLSEEQSALRRVATLVAESVPPSAVFEAVTREVGRLCRADLARMERYEQDGSVTGVAAWSTVPAKLEVGTRFDLDGTSIAREVRRTGGPVRVDSFRQATGAIAREAQELGIRSSVGCPIVVAGRLWGVIAASTKREEPFPADTESQITRFTELVVTAIANAEHRAQLAASRARVVAAADETRRRLERDLHDGAQQRLVSLALELRVAQDTVPAELPELRAALGQAADGLTEVLTELREISRGIHPAILSEGGLGPALRTLARRSAIPVQLDVASNGRYSELVEVAAYYVVSEALANATKHADASQVDVLVEERAGALSLSVRDDGAGGADPEQGTGLIGLRDRVEALGGSMDLSSPPGRGTAIQVSLPLRQHEHVR
jgi:signal transduction histidine kinase